MKDRCLRLAILTVALLSAFHLRAADASPWDEWRLGYTNFEIGEQKRSRGDYIAALSAFEKSKRHYMAVKRARPDWNQAVIRERLEACDRQIADIKRLLGDMPATVPSPGAATSSGAPTTPAAVPSATGTPPERRTETVPVERGERPRTEDSAALTAAREELRRLRAELAEAKAELEELRGIRARLAGYETEIANLLRDQRIAREKYALLERRCRSLLEELKKPESAIRELRSQLMERNERLAAAEKSIRLLEERLRRGERITLEITRERNQLRNQLRQGLEERQRLQQEIASLRTSLETERARLTRADARIAELEKSLQEAEKRLSRVAANSGSRAAADQRELVRLRGVAEAAEKRADLYQRQCIEMRGEYSELLKRLQASEHLRAKLDADIATLREESDKQRARADSLADELASVRELQRRQEAELKRVLAEIEPLRARLARRDSEDFKGMVEAREAKRRLEAEITVLRTRDAESTVALAEERKTVAALRRELDMVRGELRKAKAAHKRAEQELAAVRVDAEKYRALLLRYQALERNFAALQQENKEIRAKLAAASPREAELRRVKLRLLELDQLKSALGREQRLNAELMAEKQRLQQEIRVLRANSERLADALKQLERLKALQREVEELRRINRDAVARLEKMKHLEDELVTTKRALIESGAAQLQLLELKQAYDKAIRERDAAASEAARLRDVVAELKAREGRRARVVTPPPVDVGTAQELERTRQQLRAALERLKQLEALVPQIEQLRRLNDELMYARSFEAELIKARAALGELARYKAELAGMIQLNERLVREKAELERQLARRSGTAATELEEQDRAVIAAGERPEDYVTEGMAAESNGNLELARWNYRRALELDNKNPGAAERLGMLLLRREEFAEASRLLAIARSAAPERLDLVLAVSRAYLGQKRFGNAQAILEPMLRKNPENGELLTVAAMAAAEGGEVSRAEKYLRLAIRYNPNATEPRIELSRLLVRHDSARMEEATELYETARGMGARPDIELEPALGPRLDKRRELESFLSSAMNEAFEHRDYHGAAWYCRQLVELNRRPQYFTPLLALAKLLGGESGGARETLTFNAESAQGALVLAMIELKEGNRTAFKAAVRRALALNKGKPVLITAEWRNLGFALDAAGVSDKAAGKELSAAYRWASAR